MSVRVWVNYSISFKLPAVFGIQYFQRTFSTITWIYYLKLALLSPKLPGNFQSLSELFPVRGCKSNNSFIPNKIYFPFFQYFLKSSSTLLNLLFKKREGKGNKLFCFDKHFRRFFPDVPHFLFAEDLTSCLSDH